MWKEVSILLVLPILVTAQVVVNCHVDESLASQNETITQLRMAIDKHSETISAQNEMIKSLAEISTNLAMERIDRLQNKYKPASPLAGQ